ncbi:MAG TPA: Rid family detoxifying hydrolase [Candidatus Limnocylindria bacterium]|nr:Rid family detoxifying hydrolase [Candidatus Limnocylindria bacterium]
MSRRVVESAAAPRPVGPYAQAVDAGSLVFCAGQIGLDPATGRLVAGGTVAELRQALANLAAVLAAAGLGLDDVVKTTLFLVDLADGPAVNAAYGEVFRAPYPARSTVQVSALPAGARVEIEAIAARR